MAEPLAGVRVVDFSEGFFGPLCSMMLGDLGADVIKVERVQGESIRWGVRLGGGGGTESGDFRSQPPPGGGSALFMGFNRSKRNVALNIAEEQGREIALRLAQRADVVMHNFRPGVMERLGLDYEAVATLNPRAIYASLHGFGGRGPLARRIGGDLWVQALSGMASVQGDAGEAPQAVGFPVVDQSSAAIAAFGVMVALFSRERTGKGQAITTSLLHAALQMQTMEITTYLVDGQLLGRSGRSPVAPPYGAYRAKDGEFVTMMGLGPDWPIFCRMLGLDGLIDDPRFATDEVRSQHRRELYAILGPIFAQRTVSEWQETFRAHRLRCDPILTYDQVVEHPQLLENGMIITLEHPVRGPMRMIGPPVEFKGTPARPQLPPPLLGQHTEEVLRELGYGPQEIEDLEKLGLIHRGRA
ncbi:MAG TPA: CoA transferase [Dehalococcoidia bacterium]|nr:CoA transferase [Dehalococcoidia bacterium]